MFLVFTGRGECVILLQCFVCIVKINESKSSTSPNSPHHDIFEMLILSIITFFMTDKLLEIAGITSMVVSIGMAGGAKDMVEKGGIAGTTGTATVDSSALGTGRNAALSLLSFLHEREVFF